MYCLCDLRQLWKENPKNTEYFLFAGGFGYLFDCLHFVWVWLESFTGENMSHVLDFGFSEVELLAVKLQVYLTYSFEQFQKVFIMV